MKEIAHEIAVVSLKISNVYLVGTSKLWFLVDSGLPGEAPAIKKAVEARFGSRAKPSAIVLTHGHGDHSGSAQVLADEWDVKVYAPKLELPYLSGLSDYPPMDPTAPGFLSKISRLIRVQAVQVSSNHLSQINESDPFPGLAGWETIQTPGHSAGHVSYFRKADGVLLAGDAFTTADLESAIGALTMKQKLCRPPVPATINWPQAKESVHRLAQLHPAILAAGHGKPMLNTGDRLQMLADTFQIPSHGRYVHTAVEVGEKGTLALPPAPLDHVPGVTKSVLVLGLAVGFGALYPMVQKRLKKK